MRTYEKVLLALIAAVAIVVGAVIAGPAGAEPRHVVDESELQARIDRQVDQADADREAIRVMLEQTDVRRIAGSVGLDLDRAAAAAATLSGSELEEMAASARGINADLAGESNTVVMSATTLIIILLIILLLS